MSDQKKNPVHTNSKDMFTLNLQDIELTHEDMKQYLEMQQAVIDTNVWIVPYNEITFEKELGSGAFGQIYRA